MSQTPDPSSIRVLICEDEGLRLLWLRKALLALGYQVVGTASNGEDAVLLAGQLRPEVILMDINMSRLSGIEATKRIMRRSPTAIVMITAYSDPEQVESALAAGAAGYLVKPVRDDQLQPAISVALASRSRFNPTGGVESGSGAEVRPHQARPEQLRLEEAERQARDAHQRLQALLGELEREREATSILAKGFLGQPPTVSGLEIATRYEPAADPRLVGGDFLDFISLDEHRLAVAVGDLCGHGLLVAPHLARAKFMLRAYALEDPTPARVAARLNRALLLHLEEECPFLTLCYGVLDRRSWTCTYCCAGHPGPVIGPGEDGAYQVLRATGGLVGALEGMEYEEQSVSLPPGAALILFTDGVIEARRDGELFEHDGVLSALQSQRARDAAGIAETVLAAARNFAGGKLNDDVALAVIRRLG